MQAWIRRAKPERRNGYQHDGNPAGMLIVFASDEVARRRVRGRIDPVRRGVQLSAGVMSVCAKSSPLNNSGSALIRAKA